MMRVCPMRDVICPHGDDCSFAIDRYTCADERPANAAADAALDQAEAGFTSYFLRNYPGPDTIIHDPKWHAPRIFRAALAAMSNAKPWGYWFIDPTGCWHTRPGDTFDKAVKAAKIMGVEAKNVFPLFTTPFGARCSVKRYQHD